MKPVHRLVLYRVASIKKLAFHCWTRSYMSESMPLLSSSIWLESQFLPHKLTYGTIASQYQQLDQMMMSSSAVSVKRYLSIDISRNSNKDEVDFDYMPDDIVDILKSDHEEIYSKLRILLQTSDPEKIKTLSDEVIDKIVHHTIAEEMYVYPIMKESLECGEREVNADLSYHKLMDDIMVEMEETDTSDPSYMKLVKMLYDTFVRHIDSEETHQFPNLRLSVPDDQLVELAEKVSKVKNISPIHRYPILNTHRHNFHSLLQPTIDILRDAIRDRKSS